MTYLATVHLVDGRTFDDETLARLAVWLSPTEQQRYQRFTRYLRQRQFLIGRILLRQVLAPLLDLPPSMLHLTGHPGEVPQLIVPHRPEISFSLSHSASWVACAISLNTRLGLDIEVLNPARDFMALAQHAFSTDENRWLNAQPEIYRMQAFYRLWSRKEAYFKLNSTLSENPSEHCIEFTHPELAIALCSTSPLSALPSLISTTLTPVD